MKINKVKHFKPIENGFDLNAAEIKVLLWFLSFGRACLAILFIFSCIRVCDDGTLIKVLWHIALVFSLLFSLPLICFILMDSVLAVFGKKRWSTVEVLGAAFLGWDRFDAKTGQKPARQIPMPEGFFQSKGDEMRVYVNFIKERLDKFNQEAESGSRLSCYKCLLDACDRTSKLVAPECVNSPLRRSLFLKSLGEKYSYSDRALKEKPNEVLEISNNRYEYEVYEGLLIKELKELQERE